MKPLYSPAQRGLFIVFEGIDGLMAARVGFSEITGFEEDLGHRAGAYCRLGAVSTDS